MNNKLGLGIGIGIIALAIVGSFWYVLSSGAIGKPVVAKVNGEKITQEELDKMKNQLAVQQGIDISTFDESIQKEITTQIINMLIDQKIIEQKIKEKNIEVTDEQITEQIESVKSQFGTEEEFNSLLESEGLTQESLRERVYISIASEIYFEQEIGLESITATDEDIAKVKEELSVMSDVPADFDYILYATDQKRQQAIQTFISTLREEAEVELFI